MTELEQLRDLAKFTGWQPFSNPWFIGCMETFVARPDGGYRIPFPVKCYDVQPMKGGESAIWQNAETGTHLTVMPTFWRPWPGAMAMIWQRRAISTSTG